jgi:hypothetical protein
MERKAPELSQLPVDRSIIPSSAGNSIGDQIRAGAIGTRGVMGALEKGFAEHGGGTGGNRHGGSDGHGWQTFGGEFRHADFAG